MKQTTSKTTQKNMNPELPLTELHGLRSIVAVITRDHEDLRSMIEILKNESHDLTKKKKIYRQFSELLKSHSACEEKAVYEMALKFKDLKMGTFEAYEEHACAKTLMQKLAKTTHKDQWLGRVKVLAEMVEHHIIEEESGYLLDLQEKLKHNQELAMIDDFIKRRERSPHQPAKGKNGILTKVGVADDVMATFTH
jgi:hypothetical protein